MKIDMIIHATTIKKINSKEAYEYSLLKNGNKEEIKYISSQLASKIKNRTSETNNVIVILSVNPFEVSRYIASLISKITKIPILRLKNQNQNQNQNSVGEINTQIERMKIRESMKLVIPKEIKDKDIFFIDDSFNTGATFKVIKNFLINEGAGSVSLVVATIMDTKNPSDEMQINNLACPNITINQKGAEKTFVTSKNLIRYNKKTPLIPS